MKSKLFILLIIISILISISSVSASELQADASNIDNDYQTNMEFDPICNDESNQNQDLNLKNNNEHILKEENTNPPEIEDETCFTTLYQEINQSDDELNLTHDYIFNKSYDNASLYQMYYGPLISVNKTNFTINGNGHIIDGNEMGAEFDFENNKGEIVINDLTFKNFNQTVLQIYGKLTLNNVNFTESFESLESIIFVSKGVLNVNNCSFYSNRAKNIISGFQSNITVNNSIFSGNGNYERAISANRWQLVIHNSIFENFTFKNGAIIDFKGYYLDLENSSFNNIHSNLSGGAILGKYFPAYIKVANKIQYLPSDPMIIKNCRFENISCLNDGGAIHFDFDSGSQRIPQSLNIIDSNFTDCSSKYGGAISILGGGLNLEKSNLLNNYASFEGGAIYSSWTNINITDSSIKNNKAEKNAGAIYFDKGNLSIKSSDIINNSALEESPTTANAIYAHDVAVDFRDSTFDNGGISVYADFASHSNFTNVNKNDDIFLMDNHNYIVSVETPGIKLNLTNNEIIVDSLPSKFNSQDWGWTTPGKVQGDNDDCWAFATIASIETGLGKSTGVLYNLSQNYVQKLQLKYYEVGDLRNSLTGFITSGLGYALSWYGVLPTDAAYDDRGMIADSDMNVPRIHVQDAMFIYTGENNTIDQLKKAIIKYGAVTVQYWAYREGEEIPSEGEDISIMEHNTHFISLVGWDDNFTNDFGEAPGCWITKDSLFGYSNTGYINFADIDYFAIVPLRVAVAYIFENDIDYHVNYQTDLTCLAGFDQNYTIYSNEFTSKYDELIGAVGTYFNESGINYSFDIFVNDEKVQSQNGTSEYAGFRTIVLNNYIPIKSGDQFKVVFKSNSVPYQAWSRVHYLNGTSLVSADGSTWTDFAPLNKTVCLKVYTLNDTTKLADANDMIIEYGEDSYFSVRAATENNISVGPGEEVTFTINNNTTTVKTNSEGVAKIKISEAPGTYKITSSYNNQSYENNITIISRERTSTRIIYQNMSTVAVNSKVDGRIGKYFEVNLTDDEGQPLNNMPVQIGFNGAVYNRTTNATGGVKLQINLGYEGSYTFAIAFLGDNKYEGSFEVAIIKVSKQAPKITAPAKTYKASAKTKTITATFLSDKGHGVKGKKISFVINGKTYTGTTNDKGVASVKVSLNKKGTYTCTAKFAGDGMYKATSTNFKVKII